MSHRFGCHFLLISAELFIHAPHVVIELAQRDEQLSGGVLGQFVNNNNSSAKPLSVQNSGLYVLQ